MMVQEIDGRKVRLSQDQAVVLRCANCNRSGEDLVEIGPDHRAICSRCSSPEALRVASQTAPPVETLDELQYRLYWLKAHSMPVPKELMSAIAALEKPARDAAAAEQIAEHVRAAELRPAQAAAAATAAGEAGKARRALARSYYTAKGIAVPVELLEETP